MKKFRRKYFQGPCSNCQDTVELILIKKESNDGKLWLRCSVCAMMNDFPEERVLKTGRVLTQNEFENREKALHDVLEYNPKKTYWRGQKILHRTLGKGEVIDKQRTNGDQKVIVVRFQEKGKRTLVEQYGVSAV